MMVIVLENAPQRLRGRLSLWLTEVRAGTYVGVYSRRVRERLWDDVKALIGKRGSAVIAWATPSTESGFTFESAGRDRRECVTLDGLTLVRFHEPAPAAAELQSAKDALKKAEGECQ